MRQTNYSFVLRNKEVKKMELLNLEEGPSLCHM